MIVADTREPVNEILDILVDRLSKYHDKLPEIEYRALGHGDYFIEAGEYTALIERKEIHDLVGTLTQDIRNFQFKLNAMRQEADIAYLVVEGTPIAVEKHVYLQRGKHKQPEPVIQYETVSNFIISQGLWGIDYYQTRNLEETMHFIINMHNYLEKQKGRKVANPANMQQILTAFPYVTSVKAEAICKKYDTFKDVLLDIESWANPKLLAKINQKLRKES